MTQAPVLPIDRRISPYIAKYSRRYRGDDGGLSKRSSLSSSSWSTSRGPISKLWPRPGTWLAAVTLILIVWGDLSSSQAMRLKSECAVSAVDGTCLLTTTTTPPSHTTSPDDRDRMILDCDVYMGPSTLGEDSNLGIYTGKALAPNHTINYPEIAIPFLFRVFGSGKHPSQEFRDGRLWDRYIWEGYYMDLESYVETDREQTQAVFVPGVGCTVNSLLDMNNINSTHGSIYDTAGLHRSRDPGAGAFSPYHGARTTTVISVPAGAELFADYGDHWIPNIPGVQVTLRQALQETQHFLTQEYYPFVRKYEQDNSSSSQSKLWEDLWNFTKTFPLQSDALSNLPRVEWSSIRQELASALRIGAQPTSSISDDKLSPENTVQKFIRQQSVRSIEWLNEHAYCQDHLRPGRSTLPQAGWGAFAARDLPQGAVVGYAPLVHVGVHGRTLYTVEYDDAEHEQRHADHDDSDSNRGGRQQYDLIINYSFGHRNSTVLLTPYGGMVNYINHNRTLANVRVRWPRRDLVAHKSAWLTKDANFLRDTLTKIGLSFEYVALRAIQKGEEIFIDYGQEWEDAWNRHVQSWRPVPDSDRYVHSSQWNEPTFRTRAEQESDPYPPNLVMMCLESYTFAVDGSLEYIEPLDPNSPLRVYCHVLKRIAQTRESAVEKVDFVYTVLLELKSGESVVVSNVPSKSIFLYDKAYSNDWHLPNVFRHELRIPDDVMPIAWLNGAPKHLWVDPWVSEAGSKQFVALNQKKRASTKSASAATSVPL